MSEYIYAFDRRSRKVNSPDGPLTIHPLTFRRGSAHDLDSSHEGLARHANGVVNRIEKAWDGHDLPEYYVEGKLTEGSLVYRVTSPLHGPFWFDCSPLPGSPEVVGILTNVWRGGTLFVHPTFGIERVEHQREGGILHCRDDDPRWRVTGYGGLDYKRAEACAHQMGTEAYEHGEAYTYELVAG